MYSKLKLIGLALLVGCAPAFGALQTPNGSVTSVKRFDTAVAKTSGPYAISPSDEIIYVSGGVFQVTLPTAVGAMGKHYQIIKTDASLTNIITIGTTSSQTINYAARNPTSVTLNTLNETWDLRSDNSNWWAVHTSRTIPIGFTPVLSGMTLSSSTIYSWRDGRFLYVQGIFVVSASAGSAAQMQVAFNGTSNNVSIDTTFLGNVNQTIGSYAGNYASLNLQGQMLYINSSSVVGFGQPVTSSSSPATQNTNGSSIVPSANNQETLTFKVPISGWLD